MNNNDIIITVTHCSFCRWSGSQEVGVAVSLLWSHLEFRHRRVNCQNWQQSLFEAFFFFLSTLKIYRFDVWMKSWWWIHAHFSSFFRQDLDSERWWPSRTFFAVFSSFQSSSMEVMLLHFLRHLLIITTTFCILMLSMQLRKALEAWVASTTN